MGPFNVQRRFLIPAAANRWLHAAGINHLEAVRGQRVVGTVVQHRKIELTGEGAQVGISRRIVIGVHNRNDAAPACWIGEGTTRILRATRVLIKTHDVINARKRSRILPRRRTRRHLRSPRNKNQVIRMCAKTSLLRPLNTRRRNDHPSGWSRSLLRRTLRKSHANIGRLADNQDRQYNRKKRTNTLLAQLIYLLFQSVRGTAPPCNRRFSFGDKFLSTAHWNQ